jgi:hypothetical protein
MNKNSTLDSKLKKYSALATGVAAVAGIANAQIVYTDINPDHLVMGNLGNYSLDLNNDGTDDFDFTTMIGSTTYVTSGIPINIAYKAGIIYPASGNSWMGNSSDTTIVSVLAGSSIGSSQFFAATGSNLGADLAITIPGLYSGTYAYGPFLSQEGFVGLKFNAGANTHYGWVRVEVVTDSNSVTLSIKDYAYESTPNTAILAGLTENGPVGINEVDDFVNVINSINSLTVQTSSNYKNAEISLVSISGQKVINQQVNNSTTLLNTSDISSGIYLLSVVSDDKVYSKKVYLR